MLIYKIFSSTKLVNVVLLGLYYIYLFIKVYNKYIPLLWYINK